MLDETNRNCEIALVDELFKKCKIKAVKMVCRENFILLIERDPDTSSLEAISIFRL